MDFAWRNCNSEIRRCAFAIKFSDFRSRADEGGDPPARAFLDRA
jgi:hypothetical protein